MPTTAGIAELRAHLSDFLRRVRAGEAVVITNRGRPFGRIVPYGWPTEAEELVAWNGKALAGQAPVVRARGKRTVAELLVEERS